MFNMLLSTVALASGIATVFNPVFAVPFGASILTLLLAYLKVRAKFFAYPWMLAYVLFDPLLELLALLGVLKDSVFGKGVKWIKVSGTKYHIGSPLVPVFHGDYPTEPR